MEKKNNINASIENYKRAKAGKKGFLITENEIFYYYDNKFCSVNRLDLTVNTNDFVIKKEFNQNSIAENDIFIWFTEGTFFMTVGEIETKCYDFDKNNNAVITAVFEIETENKDNLFGIVYANFNVSNEIYFAYFADESLYKICEMLINVSFSKEKNELISDDYHNEMMKMINNKNIALATELFLISKNL